MAQTEVAAKRKELKKLHREVEQQSKQLEHLRHELQQVIVPWLQHQLADYTNPTELAGIEKISDELQVANEHFAELQQRVNNFFPRKDIHQATQIIAQEVEILSEQIELRVKHFGQRDYLDLEIKVKKIKEEFILLLQEQKEEKQLLQQELVQLEQSIAHLISEQEPQFSKYIQRLKDEKEPHTAKVLLVIKRYLVKFNNDSSEFSANSKDQSVIELEQQKQKLKIEANRLINQALFAMNACSRDCYRGPGAVLIEAKHNHTDFLELQEQLNQLHKKTEDQQVVHLNQALLSGKEQAKKYFPERDSETLFSFNATESEEELDLDLDLDLDLELESDSLAVDSELDFWGDSVSNDDQQMTLDELMSMVEEEKHVDAVEIFPAEIKRLINEIRNRYEIFAKSPDYATRVEKILAKIEKQLEAKQREGTRVHRLKSDGVSYSYDDVKFDYEQERKRVIELIDTKLSKVSRKLIARVTRQRYRVQIDGTELQLRWPQKENLIAHAYKPILFGLEEILDDLRGLQQLTANAEVGKINYITKTDVFQKSYKRTDTSQFKKKISALCQEDKQTQRLAPDKPALNFWQRHKRKLYFSAMATLLLATAVSFFPAVVLFQVTGAAAVGIFHVAVSLPIAIALTIGVIALQRHLAKKKIQRKVESVLDDDEIDDDEIDDDEVDDDEIDDDEIDDDESDLSSEVDSEADEELDSDLEKESSPVPVSLAKSPRRQVVAQTPVTYFFSKREEHPAVVANQQKPLPQSDFSSKKASR